MMKLVIFVSVIGLAAGELAFKEPPICPEGLSDEVCFGSEKYVGITDWSQYKIPLNPALDHARNMLQSAVEIEHSTIPLYLTSMYSIINTSSFAYTTIKSVVIEEMLHMTTAANVLNAIGGAPSIDDPSFIPSYPLQLPVVNISADIRRFNQISLRNFMEIERPPSKEMSISDAYHDIMHMLTELCQRYGEDSVFIGDKSLQVDAYDPSLGESALPVYSLNDALDAMEMVVEQGGGCPVPGTNLTNTSAGPMGGSLAHFARFTELLDGRLYGPNDTAYSGPHGAPIPTDFEHVYTFDPNPSISNFQPGTNAYNLSYAFASNYTALLVSLHEVFNGQPANLMSTLPQMYALRGMATQLMTTDDPRKLPNILGIGPPWEYVPQASKYHIREGKTRNGMKPHRNN